MQFLHTLSLPYTSSSYRKDLHPSLAPQFCSCFQECPSPSPRSDEQWSLCSCVSQNYKQVERVLKQLTPSGHWKRQWTQELNPSERAYWLQPEGRLLSKHTSRLTAKLFTRGSEDGHYLCAPPLHVPRVTVSQRRICKAYLAHQFFLHLVCPVLQLPPRYTFNHLPPKTR